MNYSVEQRLRTTDSRGAKIFSVRSPARLAKGFSRCCTPVLAWTEAPISRVTPILYSSYLSAIRVRRHFLTARRLPARLAGAEGVSFRISLSLIEGKRIKFPARWLCSERKTRRVVLEKPEFKLIAAAAVPSERGPRGLRHPPVRTSTRSCGALSRWPAAVTWM